MGLYLNIQFYTDKLGLEKNIDGADKKTPEPVNLLKKHMVMLK